MNKTKLKDTEQRFLSANPGGFANPELLAIAKKHKIEKMHKLTLDSFAIQQFENSEQIVQAMTKIISQSSLVSVFEKLRFRDLLKSLPAYEQEFLTTGLKEFLHGDQELGFQLMTDLLTTYKLAKWPLLTVCPYYYRPDIEIMIKPTTVKGIIAYFELEGLKYSPRPTYQFYRAYRQQIAEMKKAVDASLGFNDNAAFCGFLMMSLENLPPTNLE